MTRKQPQVPDDDDRNAEPQDVVGSEGGAGTVGNPSRVEKSGRPPRDQSPVKSGTGRHDPSAWTPPHDPKHTR